jgi:hypothetical protein
LATSGYFFMATDTVAAGFTEDKLARSRGRIGAETRKAGAGWVTFLAGVAELQPYGVGQDVQGRMSVIPQDRKTA